MIQMSKVWHISDHQMAAKGFKMIASMCRICINSHLVYEYNTAAVWLFKKNVQH